VLEGKRVVLVEDSIVRATTMRVLVDRIRRVGHAAEVHIRVASPPIISPCFYGIDMSTVGELFAPAFLDDGRLTPEGEARMADELGAESLRYLPVDSIARAIGLDADQLCRACITGEYPTPCGHRLAQQARDNDRNGVSGRTYETPAAVKT
jgi:amidophosphoribosyltransferase